MAGEWIRTTDRVPSAADHPSGPMRKDAWGRVMPIGHISCVAVLRDHPREVALLQWNLHHLCWDDGGCDDFYCAAADVLFWQPVPAPPAEEVARAG